MTPATDSPPAAVSTSDSLMDLTSMFDGPFSLDWIVELTQMKASQILAVLEEQASNGVLIRVRPAIYNFEQEQRLQWRERLSAEQQAYLHHRIALILIRELADDENKPLEIAQHLLHVPVDWNGCQWLLQAGEIYARRLEDQKAIACFSHILGQLSRQHGEQDDLLFIKSIMAYSDNYAGRTDLAPYLSLLQDARDRAGKRRWTDYEIMLEMHIAKYERLGSGFNRSFQRFEQAYARIGQINDPVLTAKATVFHSYFLFWQGRFQEAILVFEKTVPDVQKNPLGFFPLLSAIMIGHSYALVGQITQGLGMLDNLRNYCLKNGESYLLSHASSTIAMIMLTIHRYDDAIHYLSLSLKESENSRNEWVKPLATAMMTLALYRKGDLKKAHVHLRRFVKMVPEAKGNLLYFTYLLEICYLMDNGDLAAIGGLSLGDEIERMLEINNVYFKGLAYRYKAFQHLSAGRSGETIIREFNHSVDWLQKSGNRIELAQTRLAMARYYLATDNAQKAKSIIAETTDTLVSDEFNLIPDDLRPLIEKENRQEMVLAEILQLADPMATFQDNGRLLQQIITAINRITGAERGALLVLDEQPSPTGFILRASKNITMDQISDPFFSPALEMIREVVRTGQHRMFHTDPGAESGPESTEMIRSSICMPMVVRKKVIGVLYHDNRLLGNIFQDRDIKLLSFMAAFAALALDREHQSDLLKKAQEKEKEGMILPYRHLSGLDGMIGESKAFKHILAQIEHVAATDTAVLITGETGVGKNMVASAIHRRSRRSQGPIVTVQCSALTEGLITSELFGHEKGAFTGATNRHIGRFELADGGTLFLDEIGDLSLEVQARLLRVLQSKEFERVGGGKDVLVSDFRLVAATNKNLEAEVRARRFRKDLFYRINIFPINIPPLRERKEDIPLLMAHIMKRLDPEAARHPRKISQEIIRAMMQYDWPGNIRELENVLQRGVISGNGNRFELPPLRDDTPLASPDSVIQSLADNERRHILAALARTRGKVHGPGGAAELLRINSSTLASRIKKLGIKREAVIQL